jgi:hypothetical protein
MLVKLVHIKISKLHAKCPKIVAHDVLQGNVKGCEQACEVPILESLALRYIYNFLGHFFIFWF